MPTAPTLDGPSVAPRMGSAPTIDFQHSASEYGADAARGLGEAGRAVAAIGMQQWEIANQSALNDAIAQSTKRQNALQLDHATKRGQDAAATASDYEDQFNSSLDDIATSTLNNDVQRRAFQSWRLQAQGHFTNAVQTHAVQQAEVQYDSDYQARKSATVQQASLNIENPALIQQLADQNRQATEVYAKHRGMSPDQIQELNRQDAEQMGTALVQSALGQKDWKSAQGYLAKFGDQLSPATRAQLTRATTDAANDGKAASITLDVLGKTNKDGSKLDEEQAIALAKPQVDAITKDLPDEQKLALRDTVNGRILQTMRQQNSAHTEAQNQTELKILDLAVKDPRGFQADGIAPLLSQLDPNRALQVRQQFLKTQEPDKVQSRLALANYEMAITDPEKRKAVLAGGPANAFQGLTQEDRLSAIDLWKTATLAQNGNGKSKQALEGLASKHEAVLGVLSGAGMSIKKDSSTGLYDTKTAATLDWIEREGMAMQDSRADKRPLTPDDWRIIAGKAVAKHTIVSGSWFSSDTIETQADLSNRIISAIPADIKAKLELKYNAKYRRMPTNKELWNTYLDYRATLPKEPDPNQLTPEQIAEQERQKKVMGDAMTAGFSNAFRPF